MNEGKEKTIFKSNSIFFSLKEETIVSEVSKRRRIQNINTISQKINKRPFSSKSIFNEKFIYNTPKGNIKNKIKFNKCYSTKNIDIIANDNRKMVKNYCKELWNDTNFFRKNNIDNEYGSVSNINYVLSKKSNKNDLEKKRHFFLKEYDKNILLNERNKNKLNNINFSSIYINIINFIKNTINRTKDYNKKNIYKDTDSKNKEKIYLDFIKDDNQISLKRNKSEVPYQTSYESYK